MSDLQETFPKALATIRAASGLAAQDINFYTSVDQTTKTQTDENVQRLTSVMNRLSHEIDEAQTFSSSVEQNNKSFTSLLDNLFEQADIAIDDLSKRKPQLTYLEDGAVKSEKVSKPKIYADNSEREPFKPKLQEKPNALEPLDLKLVPACEGFPEHYKQPYEYEISHCEYPEWILSPCDPVPFAPWETTTAKWIDTVEGLNEMVEDLKREPVIAVDLEHHDYRSYYGILCLMQISTRNQDYIIDTLILRMELKVLNSVFTDASIVKVFHGAFMDIVWLQRDLGVYVVSLFDTYHASRALGLPRHSLAHLLETFAHFKTSKKYQLADWRMRPLSPSMLAYARSDTHFLLNIFDKLRNRLLESDKMSGVLSESRKVASKRFEFTRFRPDAPTTQVVSPLNNKVEPWKGLIYQYNIPSQKQSLLEALYEWRDQTARRDDESQRYVMPNQLLVSLVSLAPTDVAGVLSVSTYISEHVRAAAGDIAKLIQSTLAKAEKEDWDLSDRAMSVDIPEVETNPQAFEDFKNRTSNLFESGKQTSKGVSTVFSIATNIDMDSRRKAAHEKLSVDPPKVVIAIQQPQAEEPVEAENNENEKDQDEIVTLRRKTFMAPKTGSQEVTPFDYTEEKILEPVKRGERKGKKRKSFDPYAAANDGPKSAKKRQLFTQGRSLTFKK